MLKHAFSFACLCTLLSGCSLIVASKLDDKDDAGTGRLDSGSTDLGMSDGHVGMDMALDMDIATDGGELDAQLEDCTGMAEGTNCSPGGSGPFICLSEVCSHSTCGDGYINAAEGEECEDGNSAPNDGCEPSTCRYTCSTNADCDNLNACDGTETCNVGLHRCQGGLLPAEGSMCTQADTTEGACHGGVCASASCGDGVTDSTLGEECDDNNTMSGDGCESTCVYTCHNDDECNDLNVCSGTETCDLGTHVCAAGSTLSCDDSMPCTDDSCDPSSGCINKLADTDGDGFSWITCYAGYQVDCNDGDNSIFPGAPQMCDGLDHNCDMAVDDGSLSITCYEDQDNDSYPNPGSTTMGCSCPSGYIPPRSDGVNDCVDFQVDAYPGAPDFHTEYASCRRFIFLGSGISCIDQNFDWNCDGTPEKQYTALAGTGGCSLFLGSYCLGSGWTTTEVPACGTEASYRSCSNFGTGCIGFVSTVKQACR